MQHHVLAARAAPHLRAPHHHSHIAMPPPPPPPHPGMDQHMGALSQAATIATQQQSVQPPPPPRDVHHGRISHHHHHQHHQQQQQQQQLQPNAYNNSNNNTTNQMQKIRQQHQHLNTNNGHLTKCGQLAPPQAAYNHPAAAISYGQLPHHMAHLVNYAAQPQPPQPPPTMLSGKQAHYYLSSAKPKYNNNNNSNSNSGSSSGISYAHGSKTILQNTYRSTTKSNGPTTVPTVEAATVAAVPATALVEQPQRIVGNCRSGNSDNIAVTASDEICELPPSDETHDNIEAVPQPVASQSDDCSSNRVEHIDATDTLSNEDSSSARGSKDKTPMCLVNELARYNKITHQYRLTGERGPAHCKTFTVTLKLGEEEYSADGFKIKKAQHLAASKAIEETKYKHPPPKIRRNEDSSSARTHITPTVELNALAMKLGQRTYYVLDPTQMPPSDAMLSPDYAASLLPTPAAGLPPPPPPFALRRNANGAGGYVLQAPLIHPHHHVTLQTQRAIYGHQRPYVPKYQSRYALQPALGPHMLAGPHGPYVPALPVTPSKITLFVGKQKFIGVGRTLQQAKHDAAARALQVLKAQANSLSEEALEDSMDESDKKSPISQVHEMGIKRNMTVHFKVLREEGPAHMKNFITACIVGSIVTEGEGNGKKLSKKRSAEKMLIELQKLPPLTPTKQTPMKRIKVKTPGKSGTGIPKSGTAAAAVAAHGKPELRKRLNATAKEKQTTGDLDDDENPITKLIQLQQTRKEKEPIFELIAKNGNESSRRRDFVIEVCASGGTARGTGNSKKLAKRNAAQALLEILEAADQKSSGDKDQALENVVKPAASASAVTAAGKTIQPPVALDVPMVSTPAGPVPGILILRQNKKPARKKDAVFVAKANVETKEQEATPDTIMTATDEISTTNTGNESNCNETSTNDNNSNALNTSTGSNTSGVSSNSSNAPASKNKNNSSGDGDGNATGGGGGVSGGGGGGGGGGGVHMKEQLIYLSKLLDFEVNFSDYPKGNHNEFLTIVTLSTNPPQICHGVGKVCEESQNAAARNALKILSELGLNNAKK